MGSKQAYLRGDYSTASLESGDTSESAYRLGALVFLGRHEQARQIFAQTKGQMEPADLVVARFHLALSYTRTSDYKQARNLIRDNLSMRGRVSDPVSLFFIWQGLAFYRFFFAQHRRSQRAAQRAYHALLKMGDQAPSILSVLSLDLQGHNLTQTGMIRRGLLYLKRAFTLAKEKGHRNLSQEIYISWQIYRSDFSVQPLAWATKLENFLSKISLENDYTASELVLQIAKLRLMGGLYREANLFLQKHFDVIYEKQNKRKVAKLNLLLARLMFVRGQLLESLSVVKVAQNQLDRQTDIGLLIPILGFELEILQRLGRSGERLSVEIDQLMGQVDRQVHRRIQARSQGQTHLVTQGEDPLGDLLDQMQNPLAKVSDEIRTGKLLHLLPQLFGLEPGKKHLFILADRHFFSVSPDQVCLSQSPLSRQQVELLRLLSQGACSKQRLVEAVWGYAYEALRHDTLIYTAIGRLKRVLGQEKDWIQSADDSYALLPEVNFQLQGRPEPKPHAPSRPLAPWQALMNHRQLQFLQSPPGQAWSVSDYAQNWQVTRMTALRDLKQLCELGRCRKLGRGKATRYLVS